MKQLLTADFGCPFSVMRIQIDLASQFGRHLMIAACRFQFADKHNHVSIVWRLHESFVCNVGCRIQFSITQQLFGRFQKIG